MLLYVWIPTSHHVNVWLNSEYWSTAANTEANMDLGQSALIKKFYPSTTTILSMLGVNIFHVVYDFWNNNYHDIIKNKIKNRNKELVFSIPNVFLFPIYISALFNPNN
jgi:hypothetical protein